MLIWLMAIALIVLVVVVFVVFETHRITIDDVIDITADTAKQVINETRRIPRVIG